MSATNVQFSVALHLMTGLGYSEGKETTSSMLAGSVNTNPSFIRKTLSKLVKEGLIKATRGKNGSYVLARPPEKITLLDIYRASDAPRAFAIHNYPVEEQCATSCYIKPCMEELLGEVQVSVERTLAEKTLADVVANLRERHNQPLR